jgi:hypothetical protein
MNIEERTLIIRERRCAFYHLNLKVKDRNIMLDLTVEIIFQPTGITITNALRDIISLNETTTTSPSPLSLTPPPLPALRLFRFLRINNISAPFISMHPTPTLENGNNIKENQLT